MKRITILTIFCLTGLSLFAQLDFGIKAGLNLTNIKTDVLTDDFQIKSNPTSKIGYHGGVLLRASFVGIFIQPELLFSSLATEYTVTDQSTLLEEMATQRIGRIDIPVLVGAKLGSLRIGAGPVASFVVSDKSDLTDITGYEATLKSATFGFQLGVGLDLWKLGLDLRYEGSFTQLGDYIQDVSGEQINFDSRAKQLIFSLSFLF